ncbi:MAG: hypothetical protein ACYTFT_13660 [Planctomycetota bacterium]|jgi:putative sterol carrier protein
MQEFVEVLETQFKPGRITRELSYYLKLGEGAGDRWTVRVGPKAIEIKEGKHVDRADCVVKTTRKFLLAMVQKGKKPTPMDFMRGRIKSNDPMLLLELGKALGMQG